MPKRTDRVAELLTDDSFIRWINDNADKVECEKWDQWLRADPNNRSLRNEAETLIQSLRFEEEKPDTAAQIGNLGKALDAEETYKQQTRSIANHGSSWLRVAAVLVFLIGVLAVMQYAGWGPELQQKEEALVFETIRTDYGEVKQITLSDGSQIILNAHSTLTYPVTQKGGNIAVKLEGEAYFSIVHKFGKQQRTFSVRTSEGMIAVLGTKFNVNTYSADTEVVLEEGRVKLKKIDASGAPVQRYIMSPGEFAQWNQSDNNIEVNSVDTKLYTSWKSFELKFKNTPLFKIAERIKQIYGVEVLFLDEELKDVEFSGTAPNKNLAVLLEALRTLLDASIKYNGDTIIFGN